MKRSAVAKDIFRLIKTSFKRFLAIMVMVALGVSFYTGIRATSPDMKITVDNYFDENNAYDINLISTLGFNNKDITAIEKIPEINKVQENYFIDSIVKHNASGLLLSFNSINLNLLKNSPEKVINKPILLNGRMPENKNECLIDELLVENEQYKIGDIVKIDIENDEDSKDILKTYEYIITGTSRNLEYISFERGNTSKGKGVLDGYVYILEENFDMEVSNKLFITAKNTDNSRFTKTYEDEMKSLIKKIEAVGDIRNPERYEEIQKEGTKEINKAKDEIKDAEKELKDAENKIKDSENELKDGEKELKDAKNTYNSEIKKAEDKLNSAYAKLKDAKKEIDSTTKEISDGKKEIQKNKDILSKTKITLDESEEDLKLLNSKIIELEETLKLIPEDSPEYIEIATQLEIMKAQYSEGLSGLERGKEEYNNAIILLSTKENELKNGEAKLNKGIEEYNSGISEYEKGKATLETERKDGLKEIEKAEKELKEGKEKLEDAKLKFKEESEKAEKEIKDGKKEIQENEDKLKDLKEPTWYPLDWSKNEGFEGYKQNSDRIAAIGLVFPLIFFLVAALVSLTNMTRLVEEDRTTIGLYKALGYGRFIIALKYLIFAGISTLIGIVLGVLLGSWLFPTVIYDAYGIIYFLPSLIAPIDWPSAIQASIGAVLCAVLPAFFVTQKELLATPASLMRPRAPKIGKRILLEKINFIWKKLNFSQKVTFRNVFRYKKRLFMTIFGIAGCTALLVTGFGLHNSVSDIVPNQFNEIQKYDMIVKIEDNQKTVQDLLHKEKNVNNSMFLSDSSVEISANNKTHSGNLWAPKSLNKFNQFISLKERKSQEDIPLTDDHVILTEKVMSLLNIKEGDTIEIKSDDDNEKTVSVKVGKPTENYFNNYIYMSPNLYKDLYKKELEPNMILGEINDTSEAAEEHLSEDIMKIDGVLGVVFNTSIREEFTDTIEALNVVIVVLIASAAALALTVLLSLTNINIEERRQEVATLKVLGFYDMETAMYLYRENIILTIIGILAGFVGGFFLCHFVIVTAEVDLVMFGRNIHTLTYVISAAITIAFAAIVNLLTFRTVKNINMVESMKSIE